MGNVIWYLFGSSILLLAVLLGGQLRMFINMPSLSIVLGGAAVFSVAHHGPGSVIRALKSALSSESDPEQHHHYQVLQNIRRIAMACGIIGGLIGMATIVRHGNPEGAKLMGPGMAVAALSMLYGLIISELLIGPLCTRIKSRGSVHTDWSTPNDNRLYIFTIAFFAILEIVYLIVFAFLWDGGWSSWD